MSVLSDLLKLLRASYDPTNGAFKLVQVAGGRGGAIAATTVSTITTAGVVTYTAAQLQGRLILRDPNGAGRSDVSPTAANIVAGISGAYAGASYRFSIRNTADAAETITLTAGTGVTLNGTMTIAQNNTREFIVVLDAIAPGSEAVTIYALPTGTH